MANPSTMAPRPVRCAIYTRKSTEEGLEQAFNSLDAQREACAAYIASQRHEGWTLVDGAFDDGGFSGGTMERPALRRLLEEVKAKRVDTIVVYKIDRLTRSLADFSKIVDVLDAASASFVSVTQAFNTTTSMGRLTLNVLLSFAQFEREVTGERIRDKIAASKAKGMWMGGVMPLGYAVDNRKLVIDEAEAATIRLIYERYLALGSVLALEADLAERAIYSKLRTSRSGRTTGGGAMSRGALYLLLQNRTYRGEICHKGTSFPGEHEAIVDAGLFDAVQDQLERNRVDRRHRGNADHPSLLVGKLWDELGRTMSPSHATKGAKRYRYYVSRTDGPASELPTWRVPAGDIEELVVGRLCAFLKDEGGVHDAISSAALDAVSIDSALFTARRLAGEIGIGSPAERPRLLADLLERVEVHRTQLIIEVRAWTLLGSGDQSASAKPARIVVSASLARIGNAIKLVSEATAAPTRRDSALIKLIAKAHVARAAVEQNSGCSIADLAAEQGHARDYFGVLLRLSYLAPDITSAILDGRQPASLTRQKLARLSGLPQEWPAQRAATGISS